ncbi:hypothetical protein FACS1894181_04530 [Bacteroidia bacterium]|nr:hypothetical protein FACS1894181_04530 [Bacteroidia bacterium]
MENIKKTLTLTKQMTLAQVVEYFATQEERLTPFVAQVPLLANSWQRFTVANTKLETAYKHALASPLTPELAAEDSGRANEFLFMFNCVNNVLAHSTIAEEVAAARVLEAEMNNHEHLERLEYTAETAAADDLVDKFKEPAMVAALNRLGLAPHVSAFDQFNTGFKTDYRERLDVRHDYRVKGTASFHSRETAACFDAFCTDVTSLARLLTDPAELSVLSQIAASINAVTEQFTIIVHRQRHISGNNNNNGDNDGDGFTDPDIDNPDIENPPPFGE